MVSPQSTHKGGRVLNSKCRGNWIARCSNHTDTMIFSSDVLQDMRVNVSVEGHEQIIWYKVAINSAIPGIHDLALKLIEGKVPKRRRNY